MVVFTHTLVYSLWIFCILLGTFKTQSHTKGKFHRSPLLICGHACQIWRETFYLPGEGWISSSGWGGGGYFRTLSWLPQETWGCDLSVCVCVRCEGGEELEEPLWSGFHSWLMSLLWPPSPLAPTPNPQQNKKSRLRSASHHFRAADKKAHRGTVKTNKAITFSFP